MEFRIDPSSRLPIYRQLTNQFREAVARGKLLPEERLPSVRELSRTLVVNPNTIARVYTELEREGSLNTRPGLGVFLTEAVHLSFSAAEVVATVSEGVKQFRWQSEGS